jgi:hypothetical protein
MASEVKVNKISPASGTAFQIGDSGDTTTLPSGSTVTAAGTINVTGTINNTGTATGFGSIDWQTGDIKTSTFTGVAGKGYFVNTAGGAVTANLPASPSAGDQMAVSDYGNNTETNAITVGRNGSNIEGSASDYILLENGAAANFIYVDATKGWIVISTADSTASASDYIIASGGTESTSGNEKIHIFNSSGTFTVSSAGSAAGSNTVTYLVIAGGGGGGNFKGGGGGGGYRTNYGPGTPTLPGTGGISVSAQAYPITVGAGGAGAASDGAYRRGTSGANSIFSSITSAGGGGGGTYSPGPSNSSGDVEGNVGGSGGNGGGGGILENPKSTGTQPGTAGSGNTPPVSPSQGNDGGLGTRRTGTPTNDYGGGGGGGGIAGAGSNGTPGDNSPGGAGGAGTPSQISGVNSDRGGGGGGARTGSGGAGGGGAGAPSNSTTAGDGSTNEGGGGGAGQSASVTNASGDGGSGVVIIRYKYQN